MYLALRELAHARIRFALITVIIILVSALVFILGGLSNGLARSNAEALDHLGADRMLLATGSSARLERSSLRPAVVADVVGADGVTAAEPLSLGRLNVTRAGSDDVLSIAVLAISPGKLGDPGATSGDPLGSGGLGMVMDDSLANDGVKVGDTLVTVPGGVKIPVIGRTSGHQTLMVGTGFVSQDAWHEIQRSMGSSNDNISAIAVTGDAGKIDALAGQNPDVESYAVSDVIRHLPGYSEQEGTMTMIQGFLIVIAAGIIAAFFFIMTLQKTAELGVLKAIGTRTRELTVALLVQVIILSTIGILLGISAACTMQILAEGKVPFAIDWKIMLINGTILVGVAIIGAVLSLMRVSRIDPFTAINGTL